MFRRSYNALCPTEGMAFPFEELVFAADVALTKGGNDGFGLSDGDDGIVAALEDDEGATNAIGVSEWCSIGVDFGNLRGSTAEEVEEVLRFELCALGQVSA